MNDRERMLAGKLYNPYKVESQWYRIRAAVKAFNDCNFWEDEAPLEHLKSLLGKVGKQVILTPPFYCDHGDKIEIGNHFYANTGLTILDENYVRFGDNIYIGPHASIYTATHSIDSEIRTMDLEYACPVLIGSNVWICGNVIINPGVTIGDNVVIGSGSVVTKDIPAGVVAAENPCKVIREITNDDKLYWQSQYVDYKYNDEVN